MEVGLAITVGTVIVAAAVFVYQSAKESAGDSIARQRVADAQMLVENYYTQNNAFPAPRVLAEMYTNNRPDALKSPWGGPVNSSLNTSVESYGIGGTDLTGNKGQLGGPGGGCANDECSTPNLDNVYYYRIKKPGDPPPTACCWELSDATEHVYKPVGGYALAHNRHRKSYFFITSGRPAQ
jgi:type II secretory pathway pseudopilin PulG